MLDLNIVPVVMGGGNYSRDAPECSVMGKANIAEPTILPTPIPSADYWLTHSAMLYYQVSVSCKLSLAGSNRVKWGVNINPQIIVTLLTVVISILIRLSRKSR